MSTHLVLVTCLILTSGLLQAYSMFRDHFDGSELYKARAERMEEEVRRERLKAVVARYELQEFRQNVATILPQALEAEPSLERAYPLRQLASVVTRKDAERLRKEMSDVLFARGKERFRRGEYNESANAFKTLIDRYAFSPHLPEAHFLMAESYFQLRRFEECVQVVQKMVSVFPESELTGFALLRLGKVFEYQRRTDEAVEIYQTVLRSFPYREVAAQASDSLGQLEP